MNRVTIGELKAAAAKRWGHAGIGDIAVSCYRSPNHKVIWFLFVGTGTEPWPSVRIEWHSRQGAMRMALAALRSK